MRPPGPRTVFPCDAHPGMRPPGPRTVFPATRTPACGHQGLEPSSHATRTGMRPPGPRTVFPATRTPACGHQGLEPSSHATRTGMRPPGPRTVFPATRTPASSLQGLEPSSHATRTGIRPPGLQNFLFTTPFLFLENYKLLVLSNVAHLCFGTMQVIRTVFLTMSTLECSSITIQDNHQVSLQTTRFLS